MYEVEIKIEVEFFQLKELISAFVSRGFTDDGTVLQIDYYVKAVESQYGDPKAYDIERYRSEGGKYFHTKKEWEVVSGEPIRKEEEREVTQAEYAFAEHEYPQAIKIMKVRQKYKASYEGREVGLSIDSVKFDHSPRVRYFMEPEILVADRMLVSETREVLRRFVAELLGLEVSKIEEAPGMFALAFKKL